MKCYVVHGMVIGTSYHGLCLNSKYGVYITLDGAIEELRRIEKEIVEDADHINYHISNDTNIYYKYDDDCICEYQIQECTINNK